MAPPIPSTSPHQSTLRQLKWLVMLLIVSNIALGVFGFYLLRTIDRRYSELIGKTIPLLNDLQTLTARSVEAMRGTGSGLFEMPLAARENAIKLGRSTLENEKQLRARLLKDFRLPEATKERAEFETAGESFTALGTKVVELFAAGKIDEAKHLRDEALRPAFDRYIVSITKAADGLEVASLHASDDVSARTDSMSTVILGVASWPVIIFMALLLFTTVFVLGLMILFRGREMNDAP